MFKKCFYILLISAFRLGAQTYDFRNFNVDDGLAQSQVYCIFQDSKGYMWFGTNGGGASKFDGKNFQNYTIANGALSNYIYSITEDKDHTMYFGTFDGLEIKSQYHNTRFDSKNGLPGNPAVFSVFVDKTDKVWLGTQKGICFLDENKKLKKLTGDKILDSSLVWTIYQDINGNYWFGTRGQGTCKYTPGATDPFSWYAAEKDLSNWVRSFNEDTKGNIYIGMVAGLMKVDSKGRSERIDLNNLSFSNLGATCISKDKNQTLWIGTNEGVVKLNGLGYERYRERNGLCGNTILCSYIDLEGNLWFGSNGDGISKLSSEALASISAVDGLPGDYVSNTYQTKDGIYWFGVRGYGLIKWDPAIRGKLSNSFVNYRNDSKHLGKSIVDNNVNAMAEDNGGKLWIGTDAGLTLLEGEKFTNYLANTEFQTVYSILHTQDGKHYIGTRQGLIVIEEDATIKTIDAVNRLGGKDEMGIYNLAEDNDHQLWIATSSRGAVRYSNGKTEIFNSKNKFTDKTVYNVVKDKDGNMWFGTEAGVFCYAKKEFVNISEGNGLCSNQAYFLIFDNQNRLWIGTNRGVDILTVNDFLLNGKVALKHLGKEEGLKGMECNFNSACKDKDGKLWFGTVKGAFSFNPRFEKINYQEPISSLTDIKLYFEKADLGPYTKGLDSLSGLPVKLELPYSKNHVTFDFIGISQTNPNKVQYQFKLDGVDADWVPPTNKTEVTYSSLQPGNYTFHIKAMNNDGVWNKDPVTFAFKVLPPWYRTWWFYTLCALVALISIYWYNSYKTQKLRADKLKLEKEVALRTKELREEKEKVETINKEVIEQKTIIEHKNHEITDSIKYAKNIQEALLPAVLDLKDDFPDSFVLYMPKDIVSGDFYWFTKREGKNYVAAADCTGHGVPGAFMSIIGNSLLNEIISEQHIYQPAEILNHLHVGVKTALNQNKGEFERRDGMDIALCAINKEDLTLEYAGANRPLWIYRKDANNKVEIVKPDKFPIGGLEFDFEEKRQFHNHTFQLKKGDCVYVFSDGYADQFGGSKGKKFMVANLQRALAEISQQPMEYQFNYLSDIFNKWRGTYEQVDDVLVIGVRV